MQTQGFRFSFTPLPGSFSPFLHSTLLYRSPGSIQPCGVVPAPSHRVSRVPWYSGCRHALPAFAYGAFTLSGRSSQDRSAGFPCAFFCGSLPRRARTPVWAPSLSLAATQDIDVSFFSSGYLDVSVRRVPLRTLWIHVRMHEGSSCGFPHSDTHGSAGICPSPWLFAACRVFLRLLVPRHPPCALISLTCLRSRSRLHSVAASRQSGSSFRALRASGFVVISLFFLLVFRLSPFGFRRPRMSLSRRLVYLIDLIRVFLIPVFGFQGTIRVNWFNPGGLERAPLPLQTQWA